MSKKAGQSNEIEVSDLVAGGVSKSSLLLVQVIETSTGVPAVATGAHRVIRRNLVKEDKKFDVVVVLAMTPKKPAKSDIRTW